MNAEDWAEEHAEGEVPHPDKLQNLLKFWIQFSTSHPPQYMSHHYTSLALADFRRRQRSVDFLFHATGFLGAGASESQPGLS